MQFEPMELEPIKAGQERLSRVFSDEFAFAIPTYQRPYAWEREQAEALLDDILGRHSNGFTGARSSAALGTAFYTGLSPQAIASGGA